jgi:hypothetical protein
MKFSVYMADVMPVIQDELIMAIVRATAEIKTPNSLFLCGTWRRLL